MPACHMDDSTDLIIYFLENDFQDYLLENLHRFQTYQVPEKAIPYMISDLCQYVRHEFSFMNCLGLYGWTSIIEDLNEYFPEFEEYTVFI